MTAYALLRGHPIYWDEDEDVFRYLDDDSPTVDGWKERNCALCKKPTTLEGHDPCIANLPGVRNACCGHGDRKQAYIQFTNGIIIRGFDKIETDPFQ